LKHFQQFANLYFPNAFLMHAKLNEEHPHNDAENKKNLIKKLVLV